MWRVTLANLQANLTRLLLSVAVVLIGTTFVCGAIVFSDSLSNGRATPPADLDVLVAPATTGDEGGVSQGGRSVALLGEKDLAALAAVDGVNAARGVVSGYAALAAADGTILLPAGFDQRTSGTNWTGTGRLTTVAGRPPAGPGEIAVRADALERAELAVGGTATVVHDAGTVQARITGTYRYHPNGRETSAAPDVAFDTSTVQRLLGQPGKYTAAELTAVPTVDPAELATRLTLPAAFAAVDRGRLDSELAEKVQGLTGSVKATATTFTAIALLVASTLIINTFSMLAARRGRDLALLRAVGATRRQLRWTMLAEAAAVGLTGSLCGAGLGVLAAMPIVDYAATFDATLTGEVTVSALAIGTTLAIGTVLTVLAAWLPARKAARVAPAAALTDAPVQAQGTSRWRHLLGTVVAVPAALALLVATTGTSSGYGVLGMFGALLLLVATLLLVPVISQLLLRPFARYVRHRATTGLAVGNLLRHPRRTAASTAALVIGITLATAISIFAASITNVSVRGLTSTLAGELVVTSVTGGQISDQVRRDVQRVPGVADTSTLRTDIVQLDGIRTEAGTVELPSRTIQLNLAEGEPSDLADGVFVTQEAADRNGWRAGRKLTLTSTSGGSQQVTVTGILAEASLLRQAVLPTALADRHFRPGNGNPLLVATAADADLDAVTARLREVVAARPDLLVLDNEAYVRTLITEIDAFLGLTGGLLGLSILIAFLGILNTLALSITERTHEFGLLRAIGMTRRQLRTLVNVEAVLMAALGGVIGLIVGGIGGAMFQHFILERSVFALSVPVTTVALSTLGLLLGGLLAAAIPARRAARTPVLDAIRAAH